MRRRVTGSLRQIFWRHNDQRLTRGRSLRRQVRAPRAARSRYLGLLGRAGSAARGALYVIIGCIAVGIAFGHSPDQADSAGAVRLVAATPVGLIALWLLVAGFIGLALWRLSEAAYGGPGPGEQKPSSRLAALGKAVVYGALAFTIVKYAIGAGSPKSSNQQSTDLTASVLHHSGGHARRRGGVRLRRVWRLHGLLLLAPGLQQKTTEPSRT